MNTHITTKLANGYVQILLKHTTKIDRTELLEFIYAVTSYNPAYFPNISIKSVS